MNDFSEEYDFMQRIHKVEGNNNKDYTLNKDGIKKKNDDCFFGREKFDKDFYLKSKYDKYSSTFNGFEKDDKLLYMNRLKNSNEKEMRRRETSSKRGNINELARVNEIVYYIHANKKNVYEYITNQTDLENSYYQIEEKPHNLRKNLVKENEEYIYLNDNAYYKLKINREEKDGADNGENNGIEKMKIKYTLDENKSSIIENMIESDSMLMHMFSTFFSVKDFIKSVFFFLSKIFHFNFLDYTYIRNYSLTNYFDRNVKDYMKYLKKTEDPRLINHDFLVRRRYVSPYFVYNCIDCNYNTNDNGIVILSSILPFIHSFDYDYKLKQIRTKENELDNILNSDIGKRAGASGSVIDFLRKMKNFFFGKLYTENGTFNGNGGDGAETPNNSEYSEFLKKFENSINEEGELIQDILFSGKVQMIFINFKQLENNFNNVIGNIEIKSERVQVSNLILGYEKREHIKYTDILISNILKNIRKKYPDSVINDENPRHFLYEEKESSEKFVDKFGGKFPVDDPRPSEEEESSTTISESFNMTKREFYKLSDLKDYVYNSPSHLMKEKKNNCEYVTCVCFDNNSNNCNLINNFVLGYNSGKVEYIYGKILYSNISHCDLLIDYYSKKNKKFSYELSKRIFLNGSVIKISFAPNGFFCLILTSRALYICNFFYFSIYEITSSCYNSHFVNFLWINNNCYSVFSDNGYVYLYEKNSKSDGLNNFSMVKNFFINQFIYFNSICEYHLYSNCIYLYTGEIEKKKKKSANHLFKKKKKKKNKHTNDYFYKYDCNFVIIDLNSDFYRGGENGKSSDSILSEGGGVRGGIGLLKDNVTDVETNMRQIKILEKLIENGNNLDEEENNFENMLHINIKDFNNYISTIKDVNNNLYSTESGEDSNIMSYGNGRGEEFSMKKFFLNYIKDVKKHLYNLKNENIVNILLPRYYSCEDDYSHKNFLNIRFFTIEKSDNKHLIALDTETDYVYIYKIRKNVYLDEDMLDMLKTSTHGKNNNPLKILYHSYMKKECTLKDEWKIYNEYIYINTKKWKKYIKYNLLYIIKNQKKVFFPLHVHVINTKINESEYFLFIKWATIKNSFIYSSYSSLNRVTKMKDYFKKDDEKLLKVLENPKNIFLYNIHDHTDYTYLPNRNVFNPLSGRGKLMEKDFLPETSRSYFPYNRSKLGEYTGGGANYAGRRGDEYLNKTPMKNAPRNFFTSPIGNINPVESPNRAMHSNMKYGENGPYNDYYVDSSNRDLNYASYGNYANYENYGNYENSGNYGHYVNVPNYMNDDGGNKSSESDKKWSYLKKINIFNKKDESLNDNYGRSDRHTYKNADQKYMHSKNSHMFNLENDDPILSDMKNVNFFSTPNHMRYNRLHDHADNVKMMNGENVNQGDFYHMQRNSNGCRYNTNAMSGNNYDMYNYRNINVDQNAHSADTLGEENNVGNTINAYAHGDLYRTANDANHFPSDIDYKAHGKMGNANGNREDGADANQIFLEPEQREHRGRFKNFISGDSYSDSMRKYL
ncbi:conserved Plasmodium protein, unknown function [Plasmodium ovale curtisi]|uniref:Uncharacterized protein n=1 Tax=Plasmodium ovale curtisi TaxID=864141 RepID=A0A1A8WWX8_PLAOA|nr:conserved Plasmodium protein, unknown function [Plasmodium ovale curtisi]